MMKTANTSEKPRHLPVRWRENSWEMEVAQSEGGSAPRFNTRAGRLDATWLGRRPGRGGGGRGYSPWSGFTVLEMLIVVTIIGFLAALALPHLSGMSKANSMTAATQQMTAAVNLARQMAVSHRSTVYLVFDTPGAFTGPPPTNNLTTYSNLLSDQYTAYALMSPRSVGDQPGRPNPQYLTEWKTLPSGVFFATYMFNSAAQITIYSTNTLSAQRNTFVVTPFSTYSLPFPGANSSAVTLAAIAFSPSGQLGLNYDQFIPLARGAVQNLPGNVVNAVESPTGNSINDCNLIHIDYLTARPRLERNQF